MCKRILFSFLFFLLLATELSSQKYFIRRYSVEEGLPQASLHSIMQDSRGFIWMGTEGSGAVRFDGISFKTFSKAEGLSGIVVWSMLEDKNGNIWFGTDNGITIYNGLEFRFVGQNNGLKGTVVTKLVEGSNGLIWAATNDGGLASVSLGDSVIVNNFTEDEGLLSNFVFDIYEDASHKLWLGMVGGLNVISFTDSTFSKISKVDQPDLGALPNTPIISSVELSPDGSILIGSYGNGLFLAIEADGRIKVEPSKINNKYPELQIWDLLTKKNGEIWAATNNSGIVRIKDEQIAGMFTTETGLFTNQFTDIMEDLEGNTWFASFDQGAMLFDDDKFITYGEKDGIAGNIILDILFTGNDNFYVATEEGVQQFKKSGDAIKKIRYFSKQDGLNARGANTLEILKNGEIWIGTNNGINILKGSGLKEFEGNRSLGNKDINSLFSDKHNNIWLGTAGGYGKIFGEKLFFMNQEQGLINDEVQTIIEDRQGRIWLGTLGGLVRLDDTVYTDFNNEDGLSTLRIHSLAEDSSGNIWIGTFGGGIYKFDLSVDSIPISLVASKGILASNTINSLRFINDTMLVAGNDKGLDLLILDRAGRIHKVFSYSISDGFTAENVPNSITSDADGIIWIGTKKGLVRYDPWKDFSNTYRPLTEISDIKLFFNTVNWTEKGFKVRKWFNIPENLSLSHDDNHLTFNFTGFSFDNPDELQFSYFLENQSKEWSPFSNSREAQFTSLAPGTYKFLVKARNKSGTVGENASFSFTIRPPFWQTAWFLVPAFITILALIVFIVWLRERNLIREKIKLEGIVKERTREVVEQKDEIAKQRDIVTYQKKEITDSIHYAERIQRAVLPQDLILKNSFADYFILFRPKDIVSGDFYWMAQKDDHVIFTAADCTGHGVPGAFMSMLGVSFLNKIVNEEGIVMPGDILNNLRENIIYALKQEVTTESAKDGMDIALCSVDLKSGKLYFAGANNPLFLVRKEETGFQVYETKADKMPIGIYSKMENFTNHEIDIRKGDTLYLSSDGFTDQFGGPDGKKFMKPRFREMLIKHQESDLTKQREAFNDTINAWINYLPANPDDGAHSMGQIDDVLLIGIRF